jgi:hypothetical protein
MHPQYKRCKQCNAYKSEDSFELMKNRHRGRTYRRNIGVTKCSVQWKTPQNSYVVLLITLKVNLFEK